MAVNAPSSPLMQARGRLFALWLEEHPEDKAQKPFFALPLTSSSTRELPFEAPHLCDRLLARYPKEGRITATIDLATQQLLENLLRGYVRDKRETGIENASALLIDTRTMQATAFFADRNLRRLEIIHLTFLWV